MLNHKKSINTLGFATASVDAQPFKSEIFDAIWTTEVLEHLLEVRRTVSEFNRILRPGGLLVITTPYHGLVKNLILSLYG